MAVNVSLEAADLHDLLEAVHREAWEAVQSLKTMPADGVARPATEAAIAPRRARIAAILDQVEQQDSGLAEQLRARIPENGLGSQTSLR